MYSCSGARSATAARKTVRMMHPRTAWGHSGTMAREPPTEALAALWANFRRQELKVGIRYGAEAG
jgi:hypothetical protein